MGVKPLSRQPRSDVGRAPLAALFSSEELAAVLVDGVVGQVHEDVLRVFDRGWAVFLRGESGDALVEDVDSERVARRDQGVDPHVELVAVDQQGLVQVHLAHVLLQPDHITKAPSDVNSSTL